MFLNKLAAVVPNIMVANLPFYSFALSVFLLEIITVFISNP